MELRVGYLKKVLAKLDENIILADLPHGTKYFKPFNFVKRLLVLKDVSPNKEWGGETYLSINSMGSDYTGNGEQEGLKYTGVHFDEQTFSSVVDKDPKQETNKVEEYFNMYMDFDEYENTIYYKYDKERTVKDVVIKAMQEYYKSRQSEVDDLAIKLELSECRAESFKNEIDKLKSEIEGLKGENIGTISLAQIDNLIKALEDIKNWDEDLEDEWEDQGYRAKHALNKWINQQSK